jgi:hypothetical protein
LPKSTGPELHNEKSYILLMIFLSMKSDFQRKVFACRKNSCEWICRAWSGRNLRHFKDNPDPSTRWSEQMQGNIIGGKHWSIWSSCAKCEVFYNFCKLPFAKENDNCLHMFVLEAVQNKKLLNQQPGWSTN